MHTYLGVLERNLAGLAVERRQQRDSFRLFRPTPALAPPLQRSQGQEGVLPPRPEQHGSFSRAVVPERLPPGPHRQLGLPLLSVLDEHDRL